MRKGKKNADKKSESAFSIVKKTLKYFFPIAWRFKKSYFFVKTFQMIFQTAMPFFSIFFMPLIIDELLGQKRIKLLVIYAAILVVGEMMISAASNVLSVQAEKYADKFENYFAEQISNRVMELDFQLTEDKNALDQIEKARTGMSWYSGGVAGLTDNFFNLISNVISILGVITLILINAPLLVIVSGGLLFFNVFLNNRNNKIEIESFKELSKQNRIFGYIMWQLADFRYGKDIRLYGAKDMMLKKTNNTTENIIEKWKNKADKQLPNSMLQIVVDVVRDALAYFYLGYLVITGSISIGIFSQMGSASSTFYQSVQSMIYGLQDIVKKSNYAYEYVKFMDYPAAMNRGNKKIEQTSHTIEFRNVSFSYPNTDVKVLNDISVTLHSGEHLSVVGLNGAGKTTFIKLLCRLYDVDKGEILLDGVNTKEYEYDEYMKLFSVVFQDFKLFAFSVEENITLDKTNPQKAEEIVKLVGLEDKINSMPNKMNTIIFKQFDENGIEPSGGEQQKLAIARALYKNSSVVILDEPTAALDPVSEYEIYRQFNSLVDGKTAVYISHRLSSCKFCDKIAVFSEGTIKEFGTHDSLVNLENGIYAEMFAAQAQYYN